MSDAERDDARRFDNLETDPIRRDLFRLLYTLEDLLLAQRARIPAAAYQAIDTIVLEALEALRMLPR